MDPKQVLDFVGYQFDLKEGWVQLNPGWWQEKIQNLQTGLPSLGVDVPNRTDNKHRETGSPRSTSYENDTVALEKQLEGHQNCELGNHYKR